MTSYTNAIDWWGTGVIMYECLVGRLPFADSQNQDALFQKILYHEPPYPSSLSPIALDLIQQFLRKEPKDRYIEYSIFNLSFVMISIFSIGSGIDDVRDVERHSFFGNIPFRLYEEKKVYFC